jgi:hypothetical protein
MPRNYKTVNDEMRAELIRLVTKEFYTIKTAALAIGIHYENAKAIFKTYRTKSRVGKLKTRTRKMPTGTPFLLKNINNLLKKENNLILSLPDP